MIIIVYLSKVALIQIMPYNYLRTAVDILSMMTKKI